MELEILRILFHYYQERKFADEQFIKKIATIVIKDKKLECYIKGITFLPKSPLFDKNELVAMGYNPILKDIIVYIMDLQKTIQEEMKVITTLNDSEKYWYHNLRVTQMLLHEIEHANQQKKMFLNRNDIETQLLIACYYQEKKLIKAVKLSIATKKQLEERNKRYLKYYQYDLLERTAQIKSLHATKNIMEPLKQELPNLYQLEMLKVFEESLKGYEIISHKINSPTLKYLYEQNDLSLLSHLSFFDPDIQILTDNLLEKYSIRTRLTLGLPLKYFEYDDIKRTLQLKQKK